VEGYPNNDYKGFKKYEDAVAYMCETREGLEWAIENGAVKLDQEVQDRQLPQGVQHIDQPKPPESAFTSGAYQKSMSE